VAESVANHDFEVGAVDQPGFDLSEESLARLDPDEEIEAASSVIIAMAVEQDERGSTAGVDVPRFPVGEVEVVRELEVEAGGCEVVADADLDVRPEGDVIDELLGLEMSAEYELIGIDGCSDPYPKCLCSNRSGRQAEECGENAQAQQYAAKWRCVHFADCTATARFWRSHPSGAGSAGERSG